jgi:hypothetical protein
MVGHFWKSIQLIDSTIRWENSERELHGYDFAVRQRPVEVLGKGRIRPEAALGDTGGRQVTERVNDFDTAGFGI